MPVTSVDRVAAAMAIAVAASAMAFAQSTPASPRTPPVALRVACEGQPPDVMLRATIANQSSRDTAVVLGFLKDNGKTQVLDALTLLATRAITGADEDFGYADPQNTTLQQRVTPWVVRLPPGGSHEVTVPANRFMSRLTYAYFDPASIAGTRLMLEARPAKGLDVWTGRVETPIPECQ
jgi:hypothetical protein